jgi:hypothetical protein
MRQKAWLGHSGRSAQALQQLRLLFVFKREIPWEYLPRELGWGGGMSCWRGLDG